MTLLRGGLLLAVICALITLLCAWLQQPVLALVALFLPSPFAAELAPWRAQRR